MPSSRLAKRSCRKMATSICTHRALGSPRCLFTVAGSSSSRSEAVASSFRTAACSSTLTASADATSEAAMAASDADFSQRGSLSEQLRPR